MKKSSGNIRKSLTLSIKSDIFQAGRQAGRQAGKQAGKQASRQAEVRPKFRKIRESPFNFIRWSFSVA